jgi:conjugative relaxase-like TrwC/TraI family protein
MLRVIPSRNAKEYYTQSLKREDYYTEGQEITGNWQGTGAEKLGLSGPVTSEAFEQLCDNLKPGTGERLTQRTRADRVAGYDFNFHCPKSVSVVYEFTKDERILEAFKEAVNQTMREMEAEIKTRVRRKGANEDRTTGNMVWAEFVHFTARPVNGVPDPHLHAHCFAFNSTWDETEKKWKAAKFRDLKANAPYFEAAFHARFARQLAQAGYRIERTAKGWELAGVPQRVLDEFSRRTEQIERKAAELGITSAKEKDGLGALTREGKAKHLSKAELRDPWDKRISAAERDALNAVRSLVPDGARITEMHAMDFAVAHCYERASVVTDKDLLRAALRYGVGDVDLEQVRRQLLRDEFVQETVEGQHWYTIGEVLAEEKRLIEFVQAGRGRCEPLRAGPYEFENKGLSQEQRNAVLHVITSKDRVIAIRGGAGTGKTTMMREAVQAIESGGSHKVFAFAPSAEASRGVLRSEAGFGKAETVELLLQSPKLQEQVRGQVLWVDEAGLLSARSLARLTALAERQGCRLVLSGDTKQHRAVERGDALRLLEKHAGLQAAELTEIWRQKADAHKAIVADLRAGNLERAFKQLDKEGMFRELPPETRHEVLAADYVAGVNARKSALVISPTHAEGESVTAQIRERLKASNQLGPDERQFARLKNLQLTEAERSDARNYQAGQLVQFHQNAPGFRRGERVTVSGHDEQGRVMVRHQNERPATLPLDKAGRFQVYEAKQIALAAGDMVRITQNGFTRDNQRLNNGDLRQVKGFTPEGDIKLSNGWVVPKDYGNLTHGYCVTSYGSQSKSVDRVFVAESSESFRAADREQFYVSVSRFKEALTIYTDDKPALLEAVSKSSARFLAMDLATKQLSAETPAPAEREKPQQVEQEPPASTIGLAQEKAPRRKPKGIPLRKLHQMQRAQQIQRTKFQSPDRDRGMEG